MEEFENPIIDEDEIRESKKNKITMFTIIILGTIFVVMLKELAILLLLFTLPITFLFFFISLFVILVRFSEPIESLEQSEIEKIKMNNPNIDYNQGNVNVLNKKGGRKLKTLGVVFLSYIILGGIAGIMSMVMELFV